MYSHWKFSLVLLLAASTSARFDHHHVYHEVDVAGTTEGNGESDVWSREEKVRKNHISERNMSDLIQIRGWTPNMSIVPLSLSEYIFCSVATYPWPCQALFQSNLQWLYLQAWVPKFQELAIVIGTAVGSIVVALGIVALVIGIYILIEFLKKKN